MWGVTRVTQEKGNTHKALDPAKPVPPLPHLPEHSEISGAGGPRSFVAVVRLDLISFEASPENSENRLFLTSLFSKSNGSVSVQSMSCSFWWCGWACVWHMGTWEVPSAPGVFSSPKHRKRDSTTACPWSCLCCFIIPALTAFHKSTHDLTSKN